MKVFLFSSTILFGMAAYSQDNLVSADDSVKNENMLSYQLNEVVISDMKAILLGELDAKSKKGRRIGKNSRHAYYFENNIGSEGVFLKSMLFKVQKVKFKTEARIRLYKKKDYIQDVYLDTGTISYASFIPGEQIVTKEIVVYIEPGQKGVIEVDLTKYDLEMPAEGLFVSLEGVGYYDAEGREITGLKPKEMTWIDFHPSTTDNTCDWRNPQGTDNWFWINTNKWIKSEFEYTFKEEPSKKILTAPNFGLKVGRK